MIVLKNLVVRQEDEDGFWQVNHESFALMLNNCKEIDLKMFMIGEQVDRFELEHESVLKRIKLEHCWLYGQLTGVKPQLTHIHCYFPEDAVKFIDWCDLSNVVEFINVQPMMAQRDFTSMTHLKQLVTDYHPSFTDCLPPQRLDSLSVLNHNLESDCKLSTILTEGFTNKSAFTLFTINDNNLTIDLNIQGIAKLKEAPSELIVITPVKKEDIQK